LVFLSLSPIALMSTDTEIWLKSSRAFARVDFGVVSMSLIVFHSLPYRSLLLRYSQSLKLRNRTPRSLPSQIMRENQLYLLSPAHISLRWIQVTQAAKNSQRISRFSSEV
jgi:hypothetical protein